MGSFYGSVQIHSKNVDQITAVIRRVAERRRFRCLIGPALNGWIGVYPNNNGQDQTIGQAIAEAVGGEVLYLLVHDDDVCAYWFWRDAKLVDAFFSKPGYFGEENRAEQEAMVGNPQVLATLAPGKEDAFRLLLDRQGVGMESQRLERLAAAVGIANTATAYEYLKQGDAEGIEGWELFNEV